jgi:hypothetical protein
MSTHAGNRDPVRERAVARAFAIRLPFTLLAFAGLLAFPIAHLALVLFLYFGYAPHYWLRELRLEADRSSELAIAKTRLGAMLFTVLAVNWMILTGAALSGLFPPFADHMGRAERLFWIEVLIVPVVLYLVLVTLGSLPTGTREVRRCGAA